MGEWEKGRKGESRIKKIPSLEGSGVGLSVAYAPYYKKIFIF
jgi:hypothetical protein